MLQCKNCGRFLKPSRHGRPPVFCSAKCRVDWNRTRKKEKEQSPGEDTTVRMNKNKVVVHVSDTAVAELSERSFNRMMDGSVEDDLRFAHDILRAAMQDKGTSPSALAALSREFINVSRQLEDCSKNDDPLSQLDPVEVENGEDSFSTSII